MRPKDIPPAIRATKGAPFRLVVERNGRSTRLGPLRAKQTGGVYRIGIAIESRQGPGESLPLAAKDSLSLSWAVTARRR